MLVQILPKREMHHIQSRMQIQPPQNLQTKSEPWDLRKRIRKDVTGSVNYFTQMHVEIC